MCPVWTDLAPSARNALLAVAALALGAILGLLVLHGGHALLALAAVAGLVAFLAIPLATITQWYVFVSQAFPKAGRYVHAIPVDLGVILSVFLLLRWALTAVLSRRYPHTLPRGPYLTLTWAWLVWMVAEFLMGIAHGARFGGMVVEGAALGAAPLVGLWIASLPDDLLDRVLMLSRVALLFVVCFAIVQGILHGHHTTISGLTAEAGGGATSGYANIYGRNNATAVGVKAVATYQNGNLLGGYLALAAPLILLIERRTWRLIGLGLTLTATALTLSRGAWISTAAALGAAGVFSRRDRWVLWGLIGAVPVALLSHSLIKRAGHSLSTLSGRTQQYQLLWRSMTHHFGWLTVVSWLTGWGLAGGPAVPGGGRLVSLDSSILWLFLCSGLVGVVLYFGMLGSAIDQGRQTRVGRLLIAGLLGTLLFQSIDGQLFYVPTAWNFWMFAGMAVAFARRAGIGGAEAAGTASGTGAAAGGQGAGGH